METMDLLVVDILLAMAVELALVTRVTALVVIGFTSIAPLFLSNLLIVFVSTSQVSCFKLNMIQYLLLSSIFKLISN